MIKKIFKRFFKKTKNDKQRFVPIETTFKGNKLFVHDIASYELGLDEVFVKEMYKFKSEKNNPYIIDCGANLGMSVIYFKELFPNARIVAFEADNYIFEFLKKNVDSFKFANVTLFNKAVWNLETEIEFLSEGGAGGRLVERNQNAPIKKVKTIRLCEFLENEEVDFLKIDIEGAEYEVIKDCKDLLHRANKIFIEYHSFQNQNQNLDEILKIISKNGFRYQIKEAFTSKLPFMETKNNYGMDLQLNIFCYKNES